MRAAGGHGDKNVRLCGPGDDGRSKQREEQRGRRQGREGRI
ncbi:hypothetical protein ACFFX0_23990 [Citricoccus parietis]|uniref:Uncharacterized protein n=1 Tax=Citricoccus parietis TaxID=592307 RepID=A0ABV5G642_9MICC